MRDAQVRVLRRRGPSGCRRTAREEWAGQLLLVCWRECVRCSVTRHDGGSGCNEPVISQSATSVTSNYTPGPGHVVRGLGPIRDEIRADVQTTGSHSLQ